MPPKPGTYKQDVPFITKTKLKSKNITNDSSNLKSSQKSISYYSPYKSPEIAPLFVLVEFQDKKFASNHTTSYYETLLFSKNTKSLYTFFNENSGSKLKVLNNGFYSSILNNTYNMKAYGEDTSGVGSDNNPGDLALWVVEKLDNASFDFSKFDANNDGLIDALIVIHAGNAQEESANSDDIWSYKSQISYGKTGYYSTHDGYKILDYMMLAETSPLGTFCHEFGHILGLPDFYNTSTGLSTSGQWALMDSGGWVDNGDTPSHLSAWSKKYLNWGDIKTLETKGINLEISPTEILNNDINNIEFYKIDISNSPNEYFLLEYKKQIGFDIKAAGEGVLIWHIDEDLINEYIDTNKINIGIPHLAIDLVEQDGTDASIYGTNSSDPYTIGDTFGYPYNKSFSGEDTNVVINNFSIYSNYMSFAAYILKMASETTISKFYNYPNPIKNNKTTFNLELTKPLPKNAEFKIYDISGKLVYKKDIGNLDLDTNSSNYNFIYKFDWNCMNMNNQEVASGIYIFFLNADNTKKTGKLAVIK
jgi:M6 family metalloprotease-like protein